MYNFSEQWLGSWLRNICWISGKCLGPTYRSKNPPSLIRQTYYLNGILLQTRVCTPTISYIISQLNSSLMTNMTHETHRLRKYFTGWGAHLTSTFIPKLASLVPCKYERSFDSKLNLNTGNSAWLDASRTLKNNKCQSVFVLKDYKIHSHRLLP